MFTKHKGWLGIGFNLLLLFLLSCQQTPAQRGKALVERAVAAHGGWQHWVSLKDVEFRQEFIRIQGDRRDTSIVFNQMTIPYPVKIRQEIVGAPIVQAFDGKSHWMLENGVPVKDEAKLTRVRFSTLTTLFIFELPFKLMDEGTNFEYLGEETLEDGSHLEKVSVTYDPSVGDTPEDWYIFYFDKETGLLKKTAWVITAEGFNNFTEAGKYQGYREIQGIEVPTEIHYYPCDDRGNKTGPMVAVLRYSDVKFNQQISPEIFEMGSY
ncbi:MAG: DUF6503 family protein [bacterium]